MTTRAKKVKVTLPKTYQLEALGEALQEVRAYLSQVDRIVTAALPNLALGPGAEVLLRTLAADATRIYNKYWKEDE